MLKEIQVSNTTTRMKINQVKTMKWTPQNKKK